MNSSSFALVLLGSVLLIPQLVAGPPLELTTETNRVVEWTYESGKDYPNPFRDLRLTAEITGPTGLTRRYPGYWTGGRKWSFRFAAPQSGTYRFVTACSDLSNTKLHGQTGTIEVTPYRGGNPLYRHGPLVIGPDERHLMHRDGTPFLWLADSWWHGMTRRFHWPEDFQALGRDRLDKGFSVIQFAIGFPCDIEPFDPRGRNEAGDPWDPELRSINPAYFDRVDERFHWLVENGLMPNILGSWGYYMKFFGVEVMKAHWEYLIARYGAYPVTWTLAGESTLAYYPDLESHWEQYKKAFRAQWSAVAEFIQAKDPYDRLLTVHPGPGIHDGKPPIDKMKAVDFVMVQSGHSGFHTLPTARQLVGRFLEAYPQKPVMHGEVCFEGMHGGGSGEKVQRFLFWTDMLSGTCGFSYGAEGIWQFNQRDNPFGASPGGNVWGNIPWDEAAQYNGSRQVGVGRRILEQFEWWKLESRPEWIEQKGEAGDIFRAYCAGIGEDLRLVYLYQFPTRWRPVTLIDLVPQVPYRFTFIDPITGTTHPHEVLVSSSKGTLQVPDVPIMQDWILAVERQR